MLDFSALKNAIHSLQEGIAVVNDSHWFDAQPEAVRNTLIAGVIQNFEFVYELSIKMLKRQLEAEAASLTEIDESSFRDVLRLAAEKGLIVDVQRWFDYRTMRNATAHTYDHEKAAQVYRDTASFIEDAIILLKQLEKRNASATP